MTYDDIIIVFKLIMFHNYKSFNTAIVKFQLLKVLW